MLTKFWLDYEIKLQEDGKIKYTRLRYGAPLLSMIYSVYITVNSQNVTNASGKFRLARDLGTEVEINFEK